MLGRNRCEKKLINKTQHVIKYSILGGILNVCLFFLKLLSGIYVHSITIIGDGVNNLSDIGNILFSCIGIILASFGAGKQHPFGHGRIEWIFGLLSSFCIIFMGLELFRRSFMIFYHPQKIKYSNVIIVVLCISILVKVYLYFLNSKISKKYELISLKSVAIDSLSDATSTGVILIAYLVQVFWEWNIDGILGIIVAILILKNGIGIVVDIFGRILGRRLDINKYEIIRNIVLKYPNVINCYDIMIHDYGLNNLFLNLNVLVNPYEDSDTLSQQIQYDIYTNLGYFCVVHEEKICSDIVLNNNVYQMINQKLASTFKGKLHIENFRMLKGHYLVFDLIFPTTYLQNRDKILNMIKKEIKIMVPDVKIIIQCKIYNNYKTILNREENNLRNDKLNLRRNFRL